MGLTTCAPPAQQAAPSSAEPAQHEPATPRDVTLEPATPGDVTLETAPASEEDKPEALERYAVIGVALHDSLHVRKAPDLAAPALSTLSSTASGIEIVDGPVTGAGSSWVKVQHGQSSGWVNRRYLTEYYGSGPEPLLRRAHEVLFLLTARDWSHLAALVHPKKGLLFSPSASIDPECLRVSARELPRWATAQEVRTWDSYDERGQVQGTFADYYRYYIIDRDFLRADELWIGSIPDRPNEYSNIEEVFPGSATVEYHVEARNGGMNWSSLRLVFMPESDTWYLVAIVHVQWTI